MRAIVLEKFGGLDSLVYKEIPDPEPKPGHATRVVGAGRSLALRRDADFTLQLISLTASGFRCSVFSYGGYVRP
jgi:hypothetical protein